MLYKQADRRRSPSTLLVVYVAIGLVVAAVKTALVRSLDDLGRTSSSRSASSSSAAAVVGANLYFKTDKGLTVTTEVIKTRDLEAIVSASGKIQPKRLVNISADTPGRVVNLAVNEGDRVKKGQFLLQIDPKSLRTRVDSGTASLAGGRRRRSSSCGSRSRRRGSSSSRRSRTSTRQQDLWTQQLTTREALEKAENDVQGGRVGAAGAREAGRRAGRAASRRSAPALESARYDLSKVRIESPIDGIVTRRNIQEGETAVIGTMNNAGTVLLTLADMSVIQAEVEVDETNIPNVAARPAGQDHDRRAARPDRSRATSPRSATARFRPRPARSDRHAGDQLQGGRRPRRAGARRAARLHLHGRHHHRDAQAASPRCRFRRSPCASWSTTRTARS